MLSNVFLMMKKKGTQQLQVSYSDTFVHDTFWKKFFDLYRACRVGAKGEALEKSRSQKETLHQLIANFGSDSQILRQLKPHCLQEAEWFGKFDKKITGNSSVKYVERVIAIERTESESGDILVSGTVIAEELNAISGKEERVDD